MMEEHERFASSPARGDASDFATRTQVQIIVTPGSGEGRAVDTAQRLRQALAAAGWRADIRTFADLDSLSCWALSCRATFSHLVCVGGDSTQSVAAGAGMRLGVPLIPVPNGFGNMFAAAFGYRDAPEAVLGSLEHGQMRRIDVGRVGTDLFLSHRSYGPLRQIEEAVEPGRNQLRPRFLRSLAYYLMAGRHLAAAALPSIRVEVDGSLLTEDAVMVTVANVETYRGFLSLTPAAVPTDGLLDVFAMPRTTRLDLWMGLLRLWIRVRRGGDGIARCRGRRVRVTADGTAPEDIRLLPGALRVLVPPGSGERDAETSGPSAIRHRWTGHRGGRARASAGRPRRRARGRRAPSRSRLRSRIRSRLRVVLPSGAGSMCPQ